MRVFDSLVHATLDGRWPAKAGVDAGPDRLLRDMDAAKVDKACLVAVSGLNENTDVESIARAHPDRFVPVASVNPARSPSDDAVRASVREAADRGFAGIKLHPRMHGYDPESPVCLAALREAGALGLPAFVCTLFRRAGTPTRNAADTVDALANAAPETTMVLLHGGGTEALGLFELVRMHAHLRLDLSFTLLRYAGSSLDPDIRFLVEHLDQRLVVGSDYPDYAPSRAFARFFELTEGLPRDKVQRVAHDNLQTLFGHWSGFR